MAADGGTRHRVRKLVKARTPARAAETAREPDPDPALVADLVQANHILANEGVLDGYGHVSVRHDKRPDRFLISTLLTPMSVQAEHVMVLDLEGERAGGAEGTLTSERFIHSEIYRARPDVMAIVHSHSPGVIPFGVTRTRLRPIWHVSCFLGLCKVPLFDVRDTEGDGTNLLIVSRQRGKALADSLGAAPVVLMRGHGSTAVGATLRQAVFRAILTEENAKLQLESMKLGKVQYLSRAESVAAAAFIETDFSMAKPWGYWLERLRAARATPATRRDDTP